LWVLKSALTISKIRRMQSRRKRRGESEKKKLRLKREEMRGLQKRPPRRRLLTRRRGKEKRRRQLKRRSWLKKSKMPKTCKNLKTKSRRSRTQPSNTQLMLSLSKRLMSIFKVKSALAKKLSPQQRKRPTMPLHRLLLMLRIPLMQLQRSKLCTISRSKT